MFDAFEGVQNLCVDLRITEDKKKSVLKLQRLNTGFLCLPFKMEKKSVHFSASTFFYLRNRPQK